MLMLEKDSIHLAVVVLPLRPPSLDHMSGRLGSFCSSLSCIEQRETIHVYLPGLLACVPTYQ